MDEERGFLQAILEKPDVDSLKLVYADWLEERGDTRAEYLRLMTRTRRERALTPALRHLHKAISLELLEVRTRNLEAWMVDVRAGHTIRSDTHLDLRVQELEQQLADLSNQLRQTTPPRLRELAATFDTNWLALVSDPEIDGCGRSAGDSWRLRFDFVCERTWAEMQPTADSNVRHCTICAKNVYYCDNLAEARDHSQENHCIAVDIGVIRRDGDLIPPSLFLGQPSRQDLRATYEKDVDPVSRARLDLKTKHQVITEPNSTRHLPRKKITQLAK